MKKRIFALVSAVVIIAVMVIFNTEKEPLLNKDDYALEIKDISKNDSKENQKSKKQILNKSCSCNNLYENIFYCCIDYDLTNKQYELYIDLRNKLSIPYNEDDPNHVKILQDFFYNLKDIIPDEEEEIDDKNNDSNTMSTNINNETNIDNNLIKKIAKRIGFQNNNPGSDFRAGGLCALYFMNYFVIHHKIELKDILKEKYFSFALTSINLSFYIRLVLYLTNIINTETTLNTYHLGGFNRKQIKHFSEQIEKESLTQNDFIFSLMSQCLIFVFKKYCQEIDYNKKDENFVKINTINRTVINYFGKTINNINKDENLEDKLRIKLNNELITS